MKFLFSFFIIAAQVAASAQGVQLNAGDSYVFEFTSLTYERPAEPGDAPLFFARFTPGSFVGDESLRLELFPDTLFDTPLSFTFFGQNDPRRSNSLYRVEVFGSPFAPPFWPDLQGIVRITMLRGDAELDGIGIHHIVDGASYRQFFPIFVDSDHDGVPDHLDACPDTAVGLIVDANGCSIEQLVPCDRPWKNHGQYLKSLRAITTDFLTDSLITETERHAIMRQAAKSDCGKR